APHYGWNGYFVTSPKLHSPGFTTLQRSIISGIFERPHENRLRIFRCNPTLSFEHYQSYLHRLLDGVDNKNLLRQPGRLHFQAELILQCSVRAVGRIGRREFEPEIIEAFNSGPVRNRLTVKKEERAGEFINRDTVRFHQNFGTNSSEAIG